MALSTRFGRREPAMDKAAPPQREAGYYVDGTDWPAVPIPDDYPTPEEVYKALAELDDDWSLAMQGLAQARAQATETKATPDPPESQPSAE